MTRFWCPWLLVMVTGCATERVAQEERSPPIPYRAAVMFRWPVVAAPGGPVSSDEVTSSMSAADDAPAASGDADSAARSALERERIEEEILRRLDSEPVFSDFFRLRPEEVADALEIAYWEGADIVVGIEIRSLGVEESERVLPEFAAVSSLLWLGTGVGGWWIPDREYGTRSAVEVTWARPVESTGSAVTASSGAEFLSRGDHRLSFWSRGRPWHAPLAYLASFLVPPAILPCWSPEALDHSLGTAALEDVSRDLASLLRSDAIGAAGAPFRFHLEEPENACEIVGDSVRLRYRFAVEPDAEGHEITALRRLRIEVWPGGGEDFEDRIDFDAAALQEINRKIRKNWVLETVVDRLHPGLNLIRFIGQAELTGQQFANTVLVRKR